MFFSIKISSNENSNFEYVTETLAMFMVSFSGDDFFCLLPGNFMSEEFLSVLCKSIFASAHYYYCLKPCSSTYLKISLRNCLMEIYECRQCTV